MRNFLLNHLGRESIDISLFRNLEILNCNLTTLSSDSIDKQAYRLYGHIRIPAQKGQSWCEEFAANELKYLFIEYLEDTIVPITFPSASSKGLIARGTTLVSRLILYSEWQVILWPTKLRIFVYLINQESDIWMPISRDWQKHRREHQ